MAAHRETEIKLYTPDHAPVHERLVTLGACQLMPRTRETNLRFDHELLKLSERRVVLRLREDEHCTLTYKENATASDGIVSRFEAEVKVSDFADARLILEKLGFIESARYEKIRTNYALNGAEIVLDELPFGNFVEIEAAHDAIIAMLDLLNLSQAPRLPFSYLQLFAHARAWARETQAAEISEFSFASFAGIDVPLSALLLPVQGVSLE